MVSLIEGAETINAKVDGFIGKLRNTWIGLLAETDDAYSTG